MTTSPATDHGGAFVHANGIDIHYAEKGSGEPLVLLHGGLISTGPIWDGTPVSYNHHMDRLAAHFRVIAPDTRASGATVHKEGTPSASLLADDVQGLIDALGLDHPMICGFSEGALTATILSIRHPDAVRAVVNDAGFDLLDPESHMFEQARVLLGGSPEAAQADPDAAAANFMEMGMGELFEGLKADHDEAQGEGYWRTFLELTFQRWTRSPGYTFDDLRAVTAPTLVLTGDRDMFCSVEDAVTTFRKLRDAELAVVPNHDHSIKTAKVDATIEFLVRRADN